MKNFTLVVAALCALGGGCELEPVMQFGPGDPVGGAGGAEVGGTAGMGVLVRGSTGGVVGSGGTIVSSTGGSGSGGAVGSGGSNTNGNGKGGHGDMGNGGTTGGWKVTFTCSRTPDGLTAIQTWQIVNAGGPVASKSDFVLRAWFTNDGAMPTQPSCNLFTGSSSGNGCGAVRATIVSGTLNRPTADSVMEIGFSGDAGELIDTMGAMGGQLETSYHNVDWTAPNLLNDYSCTNDGRLLTFFEPWTFVGLYYKGQLVWGTEP